MSQEVLACPRLLAEIREVLTERPRLRRWIERPVAELFVDRLAATMELVPDPDDVASHTRDRGDDYLIACSCSSSRVHRLRRSRLDRVEATAPTSSHARRVRRPYPVSGIPSAVRRRFRAHWRWPTTATKRDGWSPIPMTVVATETIQEASSSALGEGARGPHVAGSPLERAQLRARPGRFRRRATAGLPPATDPDAVSDSDSTCAIIRSPSRRPLRPSNHRYLRSRSRREGGARLLDWMLT